jgi:hypothetical protein
MEIHKEIKFDKYVSTICKFFYDEDLISEEIFLEWFDEKIPDLDKIYYLYSTETDARFRKAASEFCNWLK